MHGSSRRVLIEPRLELFESLSPIYVAFIEPVATTGAAAVPSDSLELIRRTRQFIEIGQVIRMDADGANHQPQAQQAGEGSFPLSGGSQQSGESQASNQI